MKRKLLILLFVAFSLVGSSQVIINEFLASNASGIIDPDFGESSDWIELYNAGSTTVNLNGYGISDNFSDPRKWVIDKDVILKAKEYILIWADDYANGLHTNFKLSADGEELVLSNPDGILLDSYAFGLQEPDVSMGRINDGAAEWGYFTDPTPGAANSTISFDDITRNQPEFSPLGGIFTQPVLVSLKNTFGGDLRYTLDGSEPTEQSALYNSSIQVNQHTIIRARIFQSGKLPGNVVTHSYFVDPDGSIGSLPVISIASNPANFWDQSAGIYVQDFKPDWEIPINIELFENDGSDRAGFNCRAGTKINGLYSWQLPQKMLGIYFRKEYGVGKLEYPLFLDKESRIFNSFALRASGSDWAYTLFRDGMIQASTEFNMDVEIQGFRACVVFINGQYMGIHNIRSKVDDAYIIESNQLGDTAIDLIANGVTVEAGDFLQYQELKNLYSKDLSVQSNFDVVAAKMDIQNFTDFMISEIYAGNYSVDHNVVAWKAKDAGKWKWLLTDLDRGFFYSDNYLTEFFEGITAYPFGNLMQNLTYSKNFKLRFADQLFTTFNPLRMSTLIDQFAKNIESEIPKHILRWEGTSSSYGNPIPSENYWQEQIQAMKAYANVRPDIVLTDLFDAASVANISVSVWPAQAGSVAFNGLNIPVDNCTGQYPLNNEITLVAAEKSGYTFQGWKQVTPVNLIEKGSVWKYKDDGVAPSGDWIESGFDDSSWKEGAAELGYGDGDESTVIGYGSSSTNKNITSYFRKKFTLSQISSTTNLEVELKYDDGAVVYLNGKEVIRANMASGVVTNTTTAASTIASTGETLFTNFTIDPADLNEGENIIAVEVHQVSGESSDISFDLKLSVSRVNEGTLLTTDKTCKINFQQAGSYVASFERDDHCILPETVAEDLTLSKDCSPYLAIGDVTIMPDVKLTVDSGVEIWMPEGANLWVNGALITNGSASEPVIFKSNPESQNLKWGAILIQNATDTTHLKNTLIESASQGPNPTKDVAAISVFHSTVRMDSLTIEQVWSNPISARYSDVKVTNSYLHSSVTGDLINVKYGKARIENCELVGNDEPDTDGIDFDDIENGVIRNCLIHDLHGTNSDAIDIGEKAKNILIESTFAYNITDKGVSAGQQSSVSVLNSVFANCNLGAGLKDSSKVVIDHCTYYGCGIPVSCYEKNPGSAGGNARVTNSILSNSSDKSFYSDDKSTLALAYCLSDNDTLPTGNQNLWGDPEFNEPGIFDFFLASSSPALKSGLTGDIGANPATHRISPMIVFSAVGYFSQDTGAEFLAITNPSSHVVDLSGYMISKGVTFTFPQGTNLGPDEELFVTDNLQSELWSKKGAQLFQWETGKLANEGETVELQNASGMVIDHLKYLPDNPWPAVTDPGQIIVLNDLLADNHFGENWQTATLDLILDSPVQTLKDEISVYPNPTHGIIFINGLNHRNIQLALFSLSGEKIREFDSNGSGQLQINLQYLVNGIYFLRCGNVTYKLIKN